MNNNKKKMNPALRFTLIFLVVCAAVVIYAYGFKVTKVNLAETRSEIRQSQLTRILRALAKPDLLEYEKEEYTVSAPIMVPCPEGGYTPPEPDRTQAFLELEPACADPGSKIIVRGYEFNPGTEGPLNFVPPSNVNLQLGTIKPDDKGFFEIEVKIPKRPETVVQNIRAITRRNVGAPHITRTAIDTWDKIVETVFLALLATTLGTLLAVPLSFLAARNLMEDIRMALLNVSFNILAIPAGLYLGALLAGRMIAAGRLVGDNMLLALAVVILGMAVIYFTLRWAMPPEESERPGLKLRASRAVVTLLSAAVFILCLSLVSTLLMSLGDNLEGHLGTVGFLGTFIADLGDILGMVLTLVTALAGAGVLSSLAGQLSRYVLRRTPKPVGRLANIIASTAAWALLPVIIMAIINWLYQINNPWITLWGPAILGALVGLGLSIRFSPDRLLPVGFVLYFASRTIFNALRSIESLIMVIVFVVWVGIGPFAGVLALSLHTIAALAKLYSEQVESILPGPLEAVSATGANRLQTIVYAVIPQVIPPYISFTMYRWDINVRMSTIIGFAGGGGIGFLLMQNINLLNYRAASAQMLAIAFVVASMDYLSSMMREKVI